MPSKKRPGRPKWRRARPIVLMMDEPESCAAWLGRWIDRVVPSSTAAQMLLGLLLATFASPAMIAAASTAAGDAPSVYPSIAADVVPVVVNAAPAADNVVPIADRRPLPASRRSPRRRNVRSKSEVEREQRELLENTQREVDAIAAEFHQRLPRDEAKRIGMIYARYSTRFQSSVAAQVRAMYEIAVREGTFVPRGLVFFDLAVRGYRDNRPGLNGLRAALSAKQGHSLLVFGTSRLFRKAHRAVRFVEEEIVEKGMRCYFIQQNIDTAANKDWRLHLMIQAAIDENGTSMYAENIRAAHQGMFVRLEVVGTLALGYCGEPIEGAPPTRRGRPRCRIVIDQEEAKYVLKIFEWYVTDGKSMDEIAQLLNDDPQAPSPPKSMHGMWTHGSVRGVLANARYRGYWEYGKRQSEYQSSKDYVRQVDRDQSLQAGHFEQLRIITDKMWYGAQALLLKERGDRGRKPKDPNRCARPKVLNGIFWCPVHGRPLLVDGPHGGAMKCALCKAIKREVRPLYSQVPRGLALQLTLGKLAELVRGDEPLVRDTVAACRAAAEAAQQPDPERLEQLRAQVGKKTRAIQVNQRNPGETDEDQLETDRVIGELRRERTQLQAEIAQLEAARLRQADVPDEAEVRTMLADLHTVLSAAAADGPTSDPRAVRKLVEALTGGRILLYQQGERLPKRGWLQGRFRVRLLSYLVGKAGGEPGLLVDDGMEVTIDYRLPSPLDAKAEQAWQWRHEAKQKGKELPYTEIAKRLGCGRSMVTKLLKHAAALHGVPYEDGRSCRPKTRGPWKHLDKVPEVGRMVDDGRLLSEIADELGIDRNDVTRAYNLYLKQQGRPPLDGRARRKLLERKNRPPGDDAAS